MFKQYNHELQILTEIKEITQLMCINALVEIHYFYNALKKMCLFFFVIILYVIYLTLLYPRAVQEKTSRTLQLFVWNNDFQNIEKNKNCRTNMLRIPMHTFDHSFLCRYINTMYKYLIHLLLMITNMKKKKKQLKHEKTQTN